MKAVILCGGLGTRMMPYTKAQPKEMLPVLNKPLLQIIVEQVQEAGIHDILIVIGPEKECIIRHFENLFPELRISYTRQIEMKGTGPATMLAKDFIDNEPFLLIFPDELMLGQNPYKTLLDDFEKHKTSVLSSYQIPLQDAHRYGIIIPEKKIEASGFIKGIIEKPYENPPSNYASLGTYILEPAILKLIEEHKYDGKEICIVDAINMLPRLRHVELTGKRFDLGNSLGFAKANAFSAMSAFPDFKDWIKEIL